jgi:hypothetical protein
MNVLVVCSAPVCWLIERKEIRPKERGGRGQAVYRTLVTAGSVIGAGVFVLPAPF